MTGRLDKFKRDNVEKNTNEQSCEVDIDDLEDKELDLAKDLKELCDEKGKETDPSQSAIILHQMGLLYKNKRPDKLSLIRSAVLLNAAAVRQPFNIEYKHNLNELCLKVLKVSGAKTQDVDLLEISNMVADEIKLMRSETNLSLQGITNLSYHLTIDELKNGKKNLIQDIQSIQIEITEKYTQIMKSISFQCEKIMGKPPCKYAITGMGSLARKEITPYSDFEHIILLEEGVQANYLSYTETLEYFRWFSVIFQIIVINLKETIIPSVTIPSLNDSTKPNGDWFYDSITTRGISFDGLMPHACKLPLGRMEETKDKPWTTELIKPISDMLHYLDSEEDLKNGYNLSDILMRTCFVYGDETIYNKFAAKVKLNLKINKSSYHPQLMKQLQKDLKNFDALSNLQELEEKSNCNIKRVIYRSTSLFISALGRIHCIEDGSSFSIIKHLREKEIINEETKNQLMYAIAVACLCRLKVYMLKKRQDDYVGQDNLYHVFDNNIKTELIEIAGERNMVDYFVIATILQNAIRKAENLYNLQLNIAPEPVLKFKILHLLQLFDRVIEEWHDYDLHNSTLSLDDQGWIRLRIMNAYYRKKQYQQSLNMSEWLEKQSINPKLKARAMQNKSFCLFKLRRYQVGIKYIEEAIKTLHNLDISENFKYYTLSSLYCVDGEVKHLIARYRDASVAFEEAFKYADLSNSFNKVRRKVKYLYRFARCLYRLGEFEAAISKGKEALALCDQHNIPVYHQCECYKVLGLCCFENANYKEALQYFESELTLRLHFASWDTQDSKKVVTNVRDNIRLCENMLISEEK